MDKPYNLKAIYEDYEKNKLRYNFNSPTFTRSQHGPQLRTFVKQASGAKGNSEDSDRMRKRRVKPY